MHLGFQLEFLYALFWDVVFTTSLINDHSINFAFHCASCVESISPQFQCFTYYWSLLYHHCAWTITIYLILSIIGIILLIMQLFTL